MLLSGAQLTERCACAVQQGRLSLLPRRLGFNELVVVRASRYFALVWVLPTWWERIGYFAVSHAGFSIIHLQARRCASQQPAWLSRISSCNRCTLPRKALCGPLQWCWPAMVDHR